MTGRRRAPGSSRHSCGRVEVTLAAMSLDDPSALLVEWLGAAGDRARVLPPVDGRGARVAGELVEPYESLREGLLGAPDIVRRVRVALDTDEGMPSTVELARQLGVSVRSLQRHLREAGTTLRAVRVEHVVARVERLLEGTELDLGAIAALVGVGVGSASRLVGLFRHARGTTPGAFRAACASRAAE